jgi:hypothetical protein
VDLGGVFAGVLRLGVAASLRAWRRRGLLTLFPPLPVVTFLLVPLVVLRVEDEVGLGVSLAEALDLTDLLLDEVRRFLAVRDFFLGSLLAGIILYKMICLYPVTPVTTAF